MSLATYSNARAATSPLPQHRCRVTGTRHEGPAWTATVRVLRAAVTNAAEHASTRRSVNDVGVDIIDSIGLLEPKALHVLALVFGMLVRLSERDQ